MRCDPFPGCGILPALSVPHQIVTLRLAAALLAHVEIRKLGHLLFAPCNVIFSRDTMVQPDIFFVRKERSGLIGEMSVQGAPDMVIEVLSPQSHERELRFKTSVYSRFSVHEYWIADPGNRTIEILVWSEIGYISAGLFGATDSLQSISFPKLVLPLRKVFRNLGTRKGVNG